MLLANISVAEKILAEFPECAMLRRHPEPPQTNFEPLIKAARNQVFSIGYMLCYSVLKCVHVGDRTYYIIPYLI